MIRLWLAGLNVDRLAPYMCVKAASASLNRAVNLFSAFSVSGFVYPMFGQNIPRLSRLLQVRFEFLQFKKSGRVSPMSRR